MRRLSMLAVASSAACSADPPDGAAPSSPAPNSSVPSSGVPDSGSPTASAPPATSTSAPALAAPAPENPSPAPLGPRRGALSAHFSDQGTCVFAGQWIDLPAVERGHPVDATGHTLLLDGSATTSVVSCQVIESPKLRVLVTLGDFGDQDSMVTFAPAVSLSEENQHAIRIDVAENTARTDDSSCSYRALEISEDHTAFMGTFTCPHLVNDALEGSCQIDEAYFYVENCEPYEQ